MCDRPDFMDDDCDIEGNYEKKPISYHDLWVAIQLMAKDFYDASDDDVHLNAEFLAEDYIDMAQSANGK